MPHWPGAEPVLGLVPAAARHVAGGLEPVRGASEPAAG